MKLEYFVPLPIDICCSLQSFTAIALKTKKLTENLSRVVTKGRGPGISPGYSEHGPQLLSSLN